MYISPETNFRALRFFGRNLGIWPTSIKNGKRNSINEIWYSFCLLNDSLLILPIMYGFYVNMNNINVVAYTWVELVSLLESYAILIFTKFHENRLRTLYGTIEKQLSRSKPKIIKKYATMYVIAFCIILSFSPISSGIYILIEKPRSENQLSFLSAVYPFKLEYKWLRGIIYFNQFFVAFHAIVVANFDGIVVFLILMCNDNLKVLEHKFKQARSYEDLKTCIKNHVEVLDMIEEVNTITKFMIMKTVFSFVTNMVASGLLYINSTTTLQRIHQISIFILLYSRIALCAESANNMSLASEDIKNVIYSTKWYEDERKLVNAKIFIIRKCQILPSIRISGIMPSLNRVFLGKILASTISYFMALKAVTNR